METLVRFIIKLIGFCIAFILCAWFFLGVKPADSWHKITTKIQSLYTSTTQTTTDTFQSASNLSERLVDQTNKTLNQAAQSVEKTAQETTASINQ